MHICAVDVDTININGISCKLLLNILLTFRANLFKHMFRNTPTICL